MLTPKQELFLRYLCYVIAILCIILIVYKLWDRYEGFQSGAPGFGLADLDGIIFINLDKRTDRHEQITKELELMGAPANKIHRIAGVYIPKNGHKGCVQSHILALRMAQMNNWSTVAIFEDDAEVVDPASFKEKLREGTAELPPKWDVLMLATVNNKSNDIPDKKNIKKLEYATTSSAYIIHERYYAKLILLFEHINTMMTDEKWGDDNYHEPYALDQKWTELQARDNWYCLKTDLIKQRNSASTINAKGG